MIGSRFSYFNPDQIEFLKDKVLDFLETQGVELDPHEEMLKALASAGAKVDPQTGMVRIPREVMLSLLDQAPKEFRLGARGADRVMDLPRPDGTFYARSGTGAHGWIEPETGDYRKLSLEDLAQWAKLIDKLDNINFIPFLFPTGAPVQTADVHGLKTVLINTDKHAWVQPYSNGSIEYLIELGAVVAGGREALRKNPVISMIACSLSPRAFKHMDIEIIHQSARAGVPVQACSLPGAGGTAPATMPAVIILAVVEILAMTAMAQAVAPGTPVVACPIIFSTDMKTGRSLQSSVEAMKGASGAIQFIKQAFGLPTHNYGSGADSPIVDAQSMSERAMLTTLMSVSGLDILGGAGQLEVATAVSPLQIIVDNEVVGMARELIREQTLDEDTLALDLMAEVKPGVHYMLTRHTLEHCHDGLEPLNFVRQPRDTWKRKGAKDLMERVMDDYLTLKKEENVHVMAKERIAELEAVAVAADRKLID